MSVSNAALEIWRNPPQLNLFFDRGVSLMQRTFYFFLFFLFVVPEVSGQQHRVFLEMGLTLATSDYPKGFDGIGEFTHSPAVKIGLITTVNSQVDISWGLRYTRFATGDTLGVQQVGFYTSPYEPIRKLVQHYLSIPVHVQLNVNNSYVFAGPEVGIIAKARYTYGRVIRDGNFVLATEPETIDARSLFSNFNTIITIGLGHSWKMWASKGYIQLSYGHSLLKNTLRDGGAYRAGFGREFFVSTGVRI